jgi:hypothetical protein
VNGTSSVFCPATGLGINSVGPSDSAVILLVMYNYRDVQTPGNEDPKCLIIIILNMQCVFRLCTSG